MTIGKLVVAICGCIAAAGTLPGQTVSAASLGGSLLGGSFVPGTKEDEAAIREIVKASSAGKPNPHIAADLDWENAFGTRYNDLKKRDAFYSSIVAPLQKDDTDTTLEVRVKFLEPTVAVADEYWHIVGQLDRSTNKPGPDRWGRTTYVLKKDKDVWTEVLERVADLRSPYYKHYETLPPSVALATGTLSSYAGAYGSERGKRFAEVSVTGDHLTVNSRQGIRVGIPTSDTEFLLFDPNDLAEYLRIRFTKEADGTIRLALLEASGEKIMDARKVE